MPRKFSFSSSRSDLRKPSISVTSTVESFTSSISSPTTPNTPTTPKRKFSFTRWLNRNMSVPNLPNTVPKRQGQDQDITYQQKDSLFRYQLGFEDPRFLGPNAFYVAGVVDHLPVSPRVLAALQRHAILSPHPDDATVYTSRISRGFVHQFPFLSMHAQRQLVALLFFWEEELARWTGLEREAITIEEQLSDAKEGKRHLVPKTEEDWEVHTAVESQIEDLVIARTRVQVEYRMVPSLRLLQERKDGVLPGYNIREDSIPMMGVRTTSFGSSVERRAQPWTSRPTTTNIALSPNPSAY